MDNSYAPAALERALSLTLVDPIGGYCSRDPNHSGSLPLALRVVDAGTLVGRGTRLLDVEQLQRPALMKLAMDQIDIWQLGRTRGVMPC